MKEKIVLKLYSPLYECFVFARNDESSSATIRQAGVPLLYRLITRSTHDIGSIDFNKLAWLTLHECSGTIKSL